ncbi:MAG: hypothetical protein ACXU82_07785 [Caulobacteraceae bacterium]
MHHWTLSAFWNEPWTRSEIISAWSAAVTTVAILVALGLALWEHRRAARVELQNRHRFVEEMARLLRQAVSACEQCLETLAQSHPGGPDALALCNTLLVTFGDSLDVLRPLAPADGRLTVATTQTRQLLEPISEAAIRLQSAREAVDLRAQRMRVMLNRLLQLR